MSDERISSIKTSDYEITPYFSYFDTNKIRVKFDGGCLKQDPVSLFHGRIVNPYIVYEVSKNINISGYPTLENRLFGPVKWTKNTDIDKYEHSGHEMEFDSNNDWWQKKGYFNPWKRSNAGFRTYIKCWKIVFD